MTETEKVQLSAVDHEGWDVAPTKHNPAALGGPLQDIARQFRVMARVMSGVPADMDEQTTPIGDAVHDEVYGPSAWLDAPEADLAPSPSTAFAWVVGAFLALAFVVVLVLTGLGWS